jgi:hypothetical protein
MVRAKCLYALEVQAGQRPGPYSDQAATGYARRAFAHARAAAAAPPCLAP